MSHPQDKKPQTPDERERDEVLRVMLKTPPKPHKPKGGNEDGGRRSSPRSKSGEQKRREDR